MSRFDSTGPVTRPVILVSAGFPAYGDYMAHAYARPLEAAGALPLHLPYLESYDDALDLADGILMGFGGDIDPARYGGDTAHPALFGVSAARDAFELALAEAALASGKPVLGICRGMQVLNVARGGSLHADAGDHPGGDWDRWALVREAVLAGTEGPGHPEHDLRVAPGSRLAAALGPGPHRVNSWHHQALDRLGDGVEAVAWAGDGVVEAVEVAGEAWVLGVQWELQESWKTDPQQLAVFRAFVSATRRRGARRAAA
jgi:putative glutamine amidotransferase